MLYIKNVGPKSLGDNDMHLYNTYLVASGKYPVSPKFNVEKSNFSVKKMQVKVPKNVAVSDGQDGSYEKYVMSPFKTDPNKGLQYISSKSSNTTPTKIGVRTQYPPLNWGIQALGFKTGSILHKSVYTSWQFARVANLTLFIIFMMIAIILIPKGKFILSLIGSFPLTVFLASSLSADAVNISVSSLFVAYVLHLRNKSLNENQSIKLSQMLVLGAFVIVFFNLKVAYVPMLILIFLIPNYFYSMRNKILSMGASGLIGLSSYLMWSHKYSSILYGFPNSHKNFQFLLHHLFQGIFATFVYILTYPFSVISQMYSDYGSMLIVVTLFLISFILYTLFILNHSRFSSESANYSTNQKIIYYWPIILSVLAYLMVMFLTVFVLLATWTKIYSGGIGQTYRITDIQGFQARYLLPLMPMLATVYAVSDEYVILSSKNSDQMNLSIKKVILKFVHKLRK
ncbi:hypothetical protein FFIC_010070 [Fructobacillus ficulneus]|uniref:Uncharacterized protein n=2 Tax=Fructobacillus ficulneus TaxID=157463 RepID=A0A0K8MF44_9LACO|nr:hypothetical protein FFIC_010070 [Fructobacillus ficulneus]